MSKSRFSLKRFVHANNRATTLHHHDRPYPAANAVTRGKSYRVIAKQYLTDVRTKLGIKKQALATVYEPFAPGLALEGSQIRFAATKTIRNTRVISYQHSYLGIPVWREGINIRMFNDRQDVVSSSSTISGSVRLRHLEFDEKNVDDPNNKIALTDLKSTISKISKQMVRFTVQLTSLFSFLGVCPSVFYQGKVKEYLRSDWEKSVKFLDSLLNQLNWAFSEFVGMLQEVSHSYFIVFSRTLLSKSWFFSFSLKILSYPIYSFLSAANLEE